jgi:hypothetical protein
MLRALQLKREWISGMWVTRREGVNEGYRIAGFPRL